MTEPHGKHTAHERLAQREAAGDVFPQGGVKVRELPRPLVAAVHWAGRIASCLLGTCRAKALANAATHAYADILLCGAPV